ncbi:nucleotidyltransferase family protein [Candidatus Albibeggiatoa sp. nov. NOAA]|uniref:nucleotidyltransferase family protein n=1 Tax=Candidatus Albibeggiatoa sp. nov. NOAA TaxID=3162724 RepID=UPI0032FBBDAB|nr:nucleotidyltransferase family protein [Thiotrichaceae bacterium]
MKAIILAGGLGTRLRSTVPDLPKPLAPVQQRPFLAHLLDYWIQQGVDSFVLSVGYKHEMIQETFGEQYQGCPITYAVEKQPLGTGGGILLALQQLQDEDVVLAMNGDTFFKINLSNYFDFYQTSQAAACIALHHSTNTQRYAGIGLDDQQKITSFQQASSSLVNGGVYLFQPKLLLSHYPLNTALSLEQDILPHIIGTSYVTGYMESALFIDIGVPEDYHRAQQLSLV